MEIPAWVLEVINDHSGLDASLLRAGALIQATGRRVATLGLPDPAAYWPLLKQDPAELDKLVPTLTNKETYFFREPYQFDALREIVLPELLAERGAGTARPALCVWSAGCATGEEAYSLAISLLEYRQEAGAQFDVRVIGTDIDTAALERAVQGCYDERSVRLVPDALRERYFTRHGDRWCVVPAVARLVTFHTHNLAASCFPAEPGSVDIIFCRNVTIYFTEEMRERLNVCLADSLRAGGYLFVASAETLGHDRGRLALASLGHSFAFQKTPSAGQRRKAQDPRPRTACPRHRVPSNPTISSREGKPSPAVSGSQRMPQFARKSARAVGRIGAARSVPPAPAVTGGHEHPALQAAHRAFQEQAYDSALHHLDLLSAADAERREVPCLRAAILLQQEKPDEANEICRLVLDHDPWHPDAYLLLAMGYRQQGRAAEAVSALKQAIYLRPQDPQAHFFLGDTYRMLGLSVEARREYENTLNILEQKSARPSDTSTDTQAYANLAGVPDDLMRRACRTHLSRSGQRKGRGG